MKLILLFVLSVVILSQSYGFAHGAEDIVTVTTDSSSYQEGEMISISGSVSDYDESDPYKNYDVTLRLLDPNNNIISISQISLNSDGSYSTFILAQGPLWKFDGEYTISVNHGSDRNASATFVFTSMPEEVIEEEVIEEGIEIAEEGLAEGCGEGTHLEDGVCVLDETTEPTSEPTSVSTGFAPADFNALTYSVVFTVAIAFGIMIILYAISRGSRTKTA
tara:strand:- start:235 stop:894 length:660 start_codon:yes stop_codon:yes gene_type:complete